MPSRNSAPLPDENSGAARPRRRWLHPAIVGVICVAIIALYAWIAGFNQWQLGAKDSGHAYYNLLVQGFRSGQLNLKVEIPAGLARLPDPYDPEANTPFTRSLHDTSYYHGKIYLYFGITPALVLFWPFEALTGRFLFHQQAVAIFCTIGFLGSVGLLLAVRRRYFPETSFAVTAACLGALGLVTTVPVLLGRADVWEVAISCGYAMVILSLVAIWQALHHEVRRARWLAVASLLYGLAVGARPALLFGAGMLLLPVVQAWRAAPAHASR
jgi:hypothetical protein